MKAFLILEDGNVFTGTSIGSTKEVISEIVFNTSMTGYLEVLTDPSYAGQAVVMTYPLIGNYGITPDIESGKPWPDGYIVRELSRMPSNFRCEGTIQDFLTKHDIPGIAGIDTRALTKILREKGTMNGMITTNENYYIEDVLSHDEEFEQSYYDALCGQEPSLKEAEGITPELLARTMSGEVVDNRFYSNYSVCKDKIRINFTYHYASSHLYLAGSNSVAYWKDDLAPYQTTSDFWQYYEAQ